MNHVPHIPRNRIINQTPVPRQPGESGPHQIRESGLEDKIADTDVVRDEGAVDDLLVVVFVAA